MTQACRHVLVRGRVQGVAYRWWTREQARELGLAGWVRNLGDGRVEALIQGPADGVETMLARLRQGPPAARVEDLDVSAAEPAACDGFEIRPTSRGLSPPR